MKKKVKLATDVKIRIYIIQIQLPDGKSWAIEYKDGKLVSEYNCEVDEATKIFTETLVNNLGTAIDKLIDKRINSREL